MENDHAMGSQSETLKFENEKPEVSQEEKVAISVFLNEVFKRSLEILKKMEKSEESIAPNLTPEESRFVKQFLKGVFTRAIEVIKRENANGHQMKKGDLKLEPSLQNAVIDHVKEKITQDIKTSWRREFRVKFPKGKRSSKEESNVAVSSEKETNHSASVVEDVTDIELRSYQEFIVYGGKNARGHHILYMDPSKAPHKDVIRDNSNYLRLLDVLLTLTDKFIMENTNQHSFILVYSCHDELQSKSMKFQWMVRLYGLLRDRYLGVLKKLIVYKPDTKFKALLTMSKPFMRRELSSKLVIVNDPHSFAKEQYLSEVPLTQVESKQ